MIDIKIFESHQIETAACKIESPFKMLPRFGLVINTDFFNCSCFFIVFLNLALKIEIIEINYDDKDAMTKGAITRGVLL